MDSTYNKLIEAGVKLFGENGYDAVSVRDIVKESGANISAISYHFGGKAELYKAVVVHLLDEVKETMIKLHKLNFESLPYPEMKKILQEIVIAFYDLFMSKNGKYRLNIFTRETTMPDKNLAHKYFAEMIQAVYVFFRQILTAYYLAQNSSTDKVEFVIFTLFSILKNIPQQENMPVKLGLSQEGIIQSLCDLIINGKI